MMQRFLLLWLAPLFFYQLMKEMDAACDAWLKQSVAWWKIHGGDRWA